MNTTELKNVLVVLGKALLTAALSEVLRYLQHGSTAASSSTLSESEQEQTNS